MNDDDIVATGNLTTDSPSTRLEVTARPPYTDDDDVTTHHGVGEYERKEVRRDTEIGRLLDASTTADLMAESAYVDAIRAMMEYRKATLAETVEAIDVLTGKLHRLRNLAWRKNHGGVNALMDDPF